MAVLWYYLFAFGEKRVEREGLGVGIGDRKERILESGRVLHCVCVWRCVEELYLIYFLYGT